MAHRFETRAIHEGSEPDPTTGAVAVPIYQTSTYAQEAPAKHRGYDYSRTANPTRTALERCLASLEEGREGIAFASGMAALSAVLGLLRPGDHVLAPNDVYGGTYRLLVQVLAEMGLASEFVDMTDLANVERALRPETRMVLAESPTNPYLRIIDLRALADLARGRGALAVVDNTFASPYFQRPLALGCDVVVHSTTKYLGGHSDVVGGAVVVNDPAIAERLHFLQNAIGAVPGPFDAWLVLRGIRTLAVRMERHQANAFAVARYIKTHPAVRAVYYPGLPDHPNHAVAAGQMTGYSGMVSFVLRGESEARRVASRTRLFVLAESLGSVESLVDHPASMTHLSVASSPLAVDPGLLRLSVGLEHADDLIADLAQALEGIR